MPSTDPQKQTLLEALDERQLLITGPFVCVLLGSWGVHRRLLVILSDFAQTDVRSPTVPPPPASRHPSPSVSASAYPHKWAVLALSCSRIPDVLGCTADHRTDADHQPKFRSQANRRWGAQEENRNVE